MKYQRALIMGLLAFSNLASHAKDEIPPLDWKAECVGRFQLSLPGDVEVAVTSMKAIYHEVNASSSGVAFNNGNGIGRSRFYPGGSVDVSKVITFSEFEKFKKEFTSIKNEKVSLSSTIDKDGMGFKHDWSMGAAIWVYRADRIYAYEKRAVLPGIDELDKAKKQVNEFPANFKTRSLFELPKDAGICFPYGFVKDDTNRYRDVGVAMRLLDHPDIEIFFQDRDAAREDANRAPQFRGSRGNVENFWSLYGPTRGNKLEGSLNRYHDIKLAGFTGQYAFATIARPLDSDPTEAVIDESGHQERMKKELADAQRSLDYGFMAYYKGDPEKNIGAPDEKRDPDLMLYVIRTASRAVAAGKQPVSEEELKKMALQIAASVKRRKVN
jgi:hypothetical protein